MPYYPPAPQRPRQVKRFLTAREVEDLAAAGTREILQAEGLVITDAAREVAHDLGLAIRPPGPAAQAATAVAPPAPHGRAEVSHTRTPGPVPAAAAPAGRAGTDDPLVRAIVQAVRAQSRTGAATPWKG